MAAPSKTNITYNLSGHALVGLTQGEVASTDRRSSSFSSEWPSSWKADLLQDVRGWGMKINQGVQWRVEFVLG